MFNIHSFIDAIFLCIGGSVSVGWCAFFGFGQQQLNLDRLFKDLDGITVWFQGTVYEGHCQF